MSRIASRFAELKQVGRAASDWKTSDIADRITQDLMLQKSLAITKSGELARKRINRLRKELQQLLLKANNVQYEINNTKIKGISLKMKGVIMRIVVKLQDQIALR